MARPRKTKTRSKLQDAGSKANLIDDTAGPSRKNSQRSKPWKRLPSPEKSQVDTNQYRTIQLRNGVKALLISRNTNATVPDAPWASVYPGNSPHTGTGINNHLQKDFQFLETVSKMNKFSLKENMYSHTPSTMSGVSLPMSHAVTDFGVEDFMGAFERPGFVKAKPPSPPTCSLSLCLGVGSHDDPPEFPGLAHLCEHLVHHGSENFNNESGYHQAVEKLGGGRNAFTDKNKTNYHFQVFQDPGFAGVRLIMEMLADLISAPLFTLDAVRREIESVDNEYFMRKTTIPFRRDYLINNLIVEDEDHPLRGFSIGSKEKLMPGGTDEAARRLQKALKDFHRKHYHGENITIVVQANLDIESLEECVGVIFSEIRHVPTSNRIKKSLSTKNTPYHNGNLNKLLTIKPLDHSNQLTLMWALPPEAGSNYNTKPLDLIGAYLEDASPGSLVAYLKERNFILRLAAGNPDFGPYRNQYVSAFSIDIFLTSQGRGRIQEVLEAIFSYIELIKEEGVMKKNYNNLGEIERTRFKYFCPSAELWRLIQLTDNLRMCPDEEVLFGHLRLFDFDKQLINKYLKELIPSQAHYSLVTRNVGKPGFPLKEDIYGTQYLVQDIPDDMLSALEDVQIYDEFKLPDWSSSAPKNDIEVNTNLPDVQAPQLLHDEHNFALSYNPNLGMRTPQVGYFFCLATPANLKANVECEVQTIWKWLLRDSIHHDAELWIKLGTSIKFHFLSEHRFMIAVTGLNYRQQDLVDIVLSNVANLEKNVTVEKFTSFKSHIMNMLEHAALDSTWLADDLMNKLKDTDYFTSVEVIEAMKQHLNYGRFQSFAKIMKQNVKVEMVATGNTSRAEAIKIGEFIKSKRFFGHILDGTIPPASGPRAKVGRRCFPIGERCLRVQTLNKESRISTISNHYLLGKFKEGSFRMSQLIQSSLKHVLFATLRTQQQLGYHVNCSLTRDQYDIGLSIVVATHADKFCPCDIDARIDEFLLAFYRRLEETPELNNAILRACGINRPREEFLQFYEDHLTEGGSKLRKVSVQILACIGPKEQTCVELPSSNSVQCKMSTWLREENNSTSLPKLVFATERDANNNASGSRRGRADAEFFITDIARFHKACGRYQD